ncbi:HISTONE-LIKE TRANSCRIPTION FACTOR CCAAT-RELATED [Salix koriyanagi]|uniref:HISTONE-LIKE TRANSCRIPTION FACTOR CCAAT-RELATED n=1 Tax=Salix koriyanagi TaxID=2511006 RepID=A0A9Q0VSF2_9ROSI|nr:HISTONE-LIKE TRANSCRIPTION FACTOR CCAAT-RELATED [Salix koriyanagi]
MKKEVRGDSMDLNQSIEFDQASADPSPQEDGKAMPMNPSMLPHHQITTKERREQNLDQFWNQQLLEIYNSTASKSSHLLPLARIKRVIKSDGEVKMISAETPILFAKACELFILELTLRAWLQTTACKRRTLQRCHISRAVREEGMLRNLLNRVVLCDHDKVISFLNFPLLFPVRMHLFKIKNESVK